MLRRLKNYIYRGHSPYYYLRKYLFILGNWGEYRRRKRISRLSDSSNVDLVNKDGWCKIKLDPEWTNRIVSYCCQIEREKDPNDIPPDAAPGKDFWRLLIDSGNVRDHPEIIRFASQNILKTLASAYLDEEAVLSGVTLMKSYPTGRKTKHSQLWHLDGDDSKILLFYLYCRDVDEESGPFTLISKRQMKPMLRPRFLRKYGYTDDEMKAFCQPNAITPIVGGAGTAFGCDTARTYHQGSRCETKTRLALGIRYTTFSGLYPVDRIA